MINLELTREQAISLLLLIDREQDVYSTDHTAPARIVYLREVLDNLDGALDSAPSSVEA